MQYWVYILGNQTGTIYTGVTNDPVRRVAEHRSGIGAGFTKRYGISRLLLLEEYGDVFEALNREKQIKGWTRKRKLALIRESNPAFADLAADWYSTSF